MLAILVGSWYGGSAAQPHARLGGSTYSPQSIVQEQAPCPASAISRTSSGGLGGDIISPKARQKCEDSSSEALEPRIPHPTSPKTRNTNILQMGIMAPGFPRLLAFVALAAFYATGLSVDPSKLERRRTSGTRTCGFEDGDSSKPRAPPRRQESDRLGAQGPNVPQSTPLPVRQVPTASSKPPSPRQLVSTQDAAKTRVLVVVDATSRKPAWQVQLQQA
jgi:hypothetical protein